MIFFLYAIADKKNKQKNILNIKELPEFIMIIESNKNKIDFLKVIEEQPNGLLVLDDNLDIIFFNNEILEITGLNKEVITDKNINSFDLVPQDPLRTKKNFIDCLKKKKELKANFYFRNNFKNIQIFLKTKVIKIDDQYLTLISLNDLRR